MDAYIDPTFEYRRLNDLNGDIFRDNASRYNKHEPWVLKNNLPSDLHVYSKGFGSLDHYYNYFGVMKAQGEMKIVPDQLKNGDVLFFLFRYVDPKTGDVKRYLAMEPYNVSETMKYLRVGTTGSQMNHSNLEYQNSDNADINGVMIHNRLVFPIDIYYKGNLVAQAGSNDRMSPLGGSQSSVYVDNNRQGMRLGDTLYFTYSLPPEKGGNKPMYTIVLNDNKMTDIYVGIVNGNPNTFVPYDTYAYSVDRPVFSGMKFYPPAGRGYSFVTNPGSAF